MFSLQAEDPWYSAFQTELNSGYFSANKDAKLPQISVTKNVLEKICCRNVASVTDISYNKQSYRLLQQLSGMKARTSTLQQTHKTLPRWIHHREWNWLVRDRNKWPPSPLCFSLSGIIQRSAQQMSVISVWSLIEMNGCTSKKRQRRPSPDYCSPLLAYWGRGREGSEVIQYTERQPSVHTHTHHETSAKHRGQRQIPCKKTHMHKEKVLKSKHTKREVKWGSSGCLVQLFGFWVWEWL